MKRNSSRIIALVLAAALLLTLAACKDKEETAANSSTDPSVNAAVEDNIGQTVDADAPNDPSETEAESGQTSESPSGQADEPTQASGKDNPTQAGGKDTPTQQSGKTVSSDGIKETTDKAYVLKLYQECLANVMSQKPGHVKKEYQAITNHNLGSGIGTVLSLLEKLDIFKTEDSAEARETSKGDKEQGRMLKCTLSNVGVIKSASCKKSGGNYKVTLVATTAVDPSANSDFAKIMKPLTHGEVDPTLNKGIVKMVASVDGYKLTYRDCTIEFTINAKKQFQSLSQTMPCDITAWGRIGTSSKEQNDPFKATLTNYVKFSSFKW